MHCPRFSCGFAGRRLFGRVPVASQYALIRRVSVPDPDVPNRCGAHAIKAIFSTHGMPALLRRPNIHIFLDARYKFMFTHSCEI